MSNFIFGICFTIAVETLIIIYLAYAGGNK
jgi:hypothetical protein